jgi:hypothetical protein
MRRRSVLSLLAVVPVAVPAAAARAQQSTPAAGGFEIAPGVVVELLPVPEDPPALYRVRFEPGAGFPFADDPTLGVVHVESGALVLRVDHPITVARLDDPTAAGENVAGDTEVTVTAGDYFVLAPFASGEVRNEGGEAASVAVAGFVPAAAGGAATPTT